MNRLSRGYRVKRSKLGGEGKGEGRGGGGPFQESYTMLTSPKQDETAVPTLSVQILRKVAVLSLAVLCWLSLIKVPIV